MSSTRLERLKTPLTVIGLIAGYSFSTLLSDNVVLTVDDGPALWAASSFLIGGMLLLNGKSRVLCVAGCLLACVLLSLVWDSSVGDALWFMALSGGMAALVSWLTLKVCRTAQIRNLKQALKLLGLVILPAALVGALAVGMSVKLIYGTPFVTASAQWFMAAFMGVGMVLPTLFMLLTPDRSRTPRRSRFELGVLAIVVLALIAVAWTPWYMTSLLLAFPAATLFAMRLGGRVTTVSILLITLSGFFYPFVFPAPPVPGATTQTINAVIFGFQVYILFVFYNGLLTAMAMDHRSRIKRQLERRTAVARAARARATKASQAKTDFLAAMSHELRTPLNGVLGFTQILLQKESLNAETRRGLELIEKSGEALLVIVNDVLDYSRIESGRLELHPNPAAIGRLASDAAQIVAVEAQVKGLVLARTVSGEDGRRFKLDESRVRQILLNLLDNAVKFTNAGRIDLNVVVSADRARFEVTDTGVGIPEERQHGLFDGFTQVDAGLTRNHGGAGLGLAICRSLVELMNGCMGVESRPGHGSTFWFEIPVDAVADDTAAAPADDERSAHILVVDDHPVNRELAVSLLALLGCTSDVAENGAEAVSAMQTDVYDAVLMDVHMPVMDGVAATRAIRALDGAAGRTVIIGLSADVMPESVDRCRAAGMNDHLGKPVSLAKLQDSLTRCFDSGAQNAYKAA